MDAVIDCSCSCSSCSCCSSPDADVTTSVDGVDCCCWDCCCGTVAVPIVAERKNDLAAIMNHIHIHTHTRSH